MLYELQGADRRSGAAFRSNLAGDQAPIGLTELELCQQPAQSATLAGCQTPQNLVLDDLQRLVHLAKRQLTSGRELDDAAAAVGSIAMAHDELVLLELVEQAHHAARVHAQPVGEQLLSGGAVSAQITERHHMPLPQSEWTQHLLEPLADDPGDPSDQDRSLYGNGTDLLRFADAHRRVSLPSVYF